ncbi:MAG: PqqD family protein [Hyphomicrobiales bacterium]
MTYHRYENVKMIQRKEDQNTIIQGEHCIIVLEEMETFIWDRCNGEHAISDIVNDILQMEDYSQNDRLEIEEVVINYMNDLIEQELIEIV